MAYSNNLNLNELIVINDTIMILGQIKVIAQNLVIAFTKLINAWTGMNTISIPNNLYQNKNTVLLLKLYVHIIKLSYSKKELFVNTSLF